MPYNCYELFEGMMVRVCEWCSQAYTVPRTGRGRPSPYCSATCKHEAQNALAAGRMHRHRARRAGRDPDAPRQPRGRPPKR